MLELSFNESDQRVRAWLQSMPPKLTAALYQEMQRQMIGLRNYIVANKLSGQVLDTKHGTLRRAQIPTVEQQGNIIVGIEATDPTASKYGFLHEYGGTFTVREHLRNTSHGTRTVREHSITFPERSYMRSSLREMTPTIREGLQAALNKAIAQEKL